MMKVILVHGIHEKEGSSNMSVLWPYLQRHMPDVPVVLFSYGFWGFWRARFGNYRQARRLADQIEPGDVVVTHSNGAAIAYLACTKYGACAAGIININPALDRWRTAAIEWVETIHSDGDRWVWLSQWLPFHLWGDQGRAGYRGLKENTINHHASKFGPVMAYQGHCDLFCTSRVGTWAAFISGRIDERLEEAAHWKRECDKLRAFIDEYGGAAI